MTRHVLLVAVLLLGAITWWKNCRLPWIYRLYPPEPGMTLQEVCERFGRDPDSSCRIGNGLVAWWDPHTFDSADPGPMTATSTLASVNQLPFFYACVEVLVDKHGRVAAFTTCAGEAGGLHTARGRLRAESMGELSQAALERLIEGR